MQHVQGLPLGSHAASLTAFEDASFRDAARAVQARREEGEDDGGDWGVLARNLQVINQASPCSPRAAAATEATKRSPFLDRDVAASVDVRPL